MECAAMGVPAVTTDLSGFGAYMEHHVENNAENGMVVIDRSTRNFDQSTDDLVDYLYNFVQMSRRQRTELSNRVERLSDMFDWSVLVSHYNQAHDMALDRRGARRTGTLEVRLL
jgi:glycogen(starch) synthase